MRRKFFFKSYGLEAILVLVALAVGEIVWAAEPGAIYTIFGGVSSNTVYNIDVDIRIDQSPSGPSGSAYAWVLVIIFSDGSTSEGGFTWSSGTKQAKWGSNLISFDWQVGRWYRYRVWRLQQNPDGSWRWGFWILNYSTSQETFIGSVDSNGQFISTTQTPRVYTGAAGVACTDPSVEASWRTPVYRNGGGPFTVLSGTASYTGTCTDPNNTNQWLVSPSPEWKHKTNTSRTTSEGTALWSLQFQGGGTLGFGPYFQPGQEITNAVAIRYKFRVNQNSSPLLKIVFTGRRLYNPSSPTYTYLLEANLYTYWVQYTDNAFNCSWPLQGQYFYGQSGLWVSIPDYPGESQRPSLVGVRPSNLQMFPRQNSGIDNIPGLTKIETISQMDITGKDISIQYYRGNLLDPATDGLSGWGYRFQRDPQDPNIITCEPDLPSGYTYRKWHAEAVIDGITYLWDFAVPDDSARYLFPTSDMTSIVTEFLATPGFFQVYFWDFEIQREGSSIWERLDTWKVFYQPDAPTPTSGWGPKIGDYNGKPVLEVSNDGTDTYFKLNDIFQIPSTGALFRIERATGNVYADGSFNPGGADLAERIDVSEPVEPGDVVELDPSNPKHYRKARTPYSSLVAGVVSTKPGIIIGDQALTKLQSLNPTLDSSRKHFETALPLSLSLTKLDQGVLVLNSMSVAQLAPYWEYLREDDPRPLLALLGRVPVKATTENGRSADEFFEAGVCHALQ